MGTSKDYSGGKGGAWTTAKRIASQIARDGPSTDRIARYAEAYVAALGGAAQAAEQSIGARRTAANVGGFFDNVREKGLTQTLTDMGMADAIGKSSLELIGLLADRLSGDGSTLDDTAVREALIDCLRLEFEEKEYDELQGAALTEDDVRDSLASFLSRFVFWKVLSLLMAKLKSASPADRRRTEEELGDYASARCRDAVREIDLRGFRAADAGMALATSIVERAYALFAL